MSASQEGKIKNPNTGRMIQIGKGVYQKLLEEGYTLVNGELVLKGHHRNDDVPNNEDSDIPEKKPQNLTSTRVISLKGKRDILGPSNEDLPEDHVYIGRSLNMGGWKMKKSKWANPFKVNDGDRVTALRKYRQHVLGNQELIDSLNELVGKVLCCWCSPEQCHGDVLVDLINERTGENRSIYPRIDEVME